MDDCRKCKDYRNCTRNHVWFHYGEIRFCPHQIIWIIEYSGILLAGDWPPEPNGSSYIDPEVRTGYASEAHYAKPVGILGEVNARLAKTGTHGKLLRAEVLAGLDLSPESWDALMYCKGWRRKKTPYNQWRVSRNYYKKLIKTVKT